MRTRNIILFLFFWLAAAAATAIICDEESSYKPLIRRKRCAGCGDLTAGPSYTGGMMQGIYDVTEIPGSSCSQTITCTGFTPNKESAVSISVLPHGETDPNSSPTTAFEMNEASVNTTLQCGEDGAWYLDSFPTTPLSGTFYCESTPPAPSWLIGDSFKCFHGENSKTPSISIKCPSKKCISMYNHEIDYYAATCFNGSYKNLVEIFPKLKNLLVDYDICETHECNGGVEFIGSNQYGVHTFSNSPLWFQANLTHGDIFTIIGKPLPNATIFRLIIKNEYGGIIFKLTFNLKKGYVSVKGIFIKNDEGKRHRRKYRKKLKLDDAKENIEIIFDEKSLSINGKKIFKIMMPMLSLMQKIVYGGKWKIIKSYKIEKNGTKVTYITPTPSNDEEKETPVTEPPPSSSICSNPLKTDKRFYLSNKPFSMNITITKKENAFINLKFQTNPCDNSDIPLFLSLSWNYKPKKITTDDSLNQNQIISEINSNQTNNNDINFMVVDHWFKATSWSRYNNLWSEGNVSTTISLNHLKIFNLNIHYTRDNTLIINSSSDENFDIQIIEINGTESIKYLAVEDPYNALLDVNFVTEVS